MMAYSVTFALSKNMISHEKIHQVDTWCPPAFYRGIKMLSSIFEKIWSEKAFAQDASSIFFMRGERKANLF